MILCPGQGAQAIGMGKVWAEASPEAKAVFEEADRILGFELSSLCFDGPADKLDRTDFGQPALFTAAVASYHGLKARGETGPLVAAAGLSLGEFTALHLAGAFDFESGLKLVRLRGQAMQEAAEAVPSGMVVLIGAEEAQAVELCDKAAGDDVLVPANFNAPGQIVISGAKAACERSVDVAGEMGLHAKPLNVAGAFHSPLMQPAADRLGEALEAVSWSTLDAPVLSNVTALPHDNDAASIRGRLVEQLTSSVRWADSMSWAASNIEADFFELAPGKTLAGLMRRIDRKTKVTVCQEPAA